VFIFEIRNQFHELIFNNYSAAKGKWNIVLTRSWFISFICPILMMVRSSRSILSILVLISSTVCAQGRTDDFLKDLIWQHASPQLQHVLSQPDSFHYQIIYTRIDRDQHNHPRFTSFFYRFDTADYFNPASTVKMPLSFLALEKINGLKKKGISKFTPMLTDSSFSGQSTVVADTSSDNGWPSIGHYIKKVFLVSDNDAYNRLYEFLGQQHINERLWQMGYRDVRITRRFVPMSEEENRHTNSIRFIQNGKLLYNQPAAESTVAFDFSKPVFIGRAHWDQNDSLIQSPMDFTRHNNISLLDLHTILRSVLFPESVPPQKRFNLKKDDYEFLYRYMSEYPYESHYPNYDTSEFFQSYAKFFFKAGRSPIPSSIRIFNKPGWSYGYLTDVTYVADFKNKVEFMLSAVIYVNKDGVLNDNKYEYEEVGYPFFKEVFNIIYNYELQRERAHAPDLRKFMIDYNAK
ncbi:MAG: serine hydrolase, partial [Flavisolibacter sp.]